MRRRIFLGKATLAGGLAALSLPRTKARSQNAGANDQVRIGLIGCRVRGPQLVSDLNRHAEGARVVAACDADERLSAGFASNHEGVAMIDDYRRMLERDDIDAVIIATPNHTHATIGTAACAAGKDVYVEKPVSNNIHEGRALVEAAKRHNRIVQAGLQNRSDAGIDAARDYFQSGALGKLLAAHCFWFNRRAPIGKVDRPTPVDPEINYDLFQGPRPLVPVMREQFHYDWHWFWATGSGEFGNVGVHNLDHTLHILGIRDHATAVRCVGGRLLWDDDGETPNTQLASFRFPGLDVPLTCEVRDLPMSPERDDVQSRFRNRTAGTFLICENGALFFNRGGGHAEDSEGNVIERFRGDGGGPHVANWIEAIRSRDTSSLRCDVDQGHYSSAACHMANISLRSGIRAFDADSLEAEAPAGIADQTEAWESFLEHCRVHPIDYAKTPLSLGSTLVFDPASERFDESSPEGVMANYLLSDTYREPFTLA